MRLVLALSLFSAAPVGAQTAHLTSVVDTAELEPLARRIVDASGADSGSVAVVSTGRPSLALAEAVAVEFIAGGVRDMIQKA